MSTPDLRSIVRGHMPVMDGWRGVAILVVVVHNAGSVLYGEPNALVAVTTTVLESGWVGVQLFFVLSGFLITGILLDALGSERYFRDFYIRRTLRIFPLYYGFLAIALLLPFAFVGRGPSAPESAIWYWLYLSNWTPLIDGGIDGLQHIWSLAVEEQFYLVWPAVVALSGRRFPAVVYTILIGTPLLRAGMYAGGLDPDYLYHFTIARMDALAFGAAIAVGARDERILATVWRRRRALLVSATVGLVAVVGVARGFHQYSTIVLIAGQSLISLWFAVLMLGSLAPNGRIEVGLARILASRWLGGFGKYSYAIYVFHFPIHAYWRPDVHPLVEQGPTFTRIGLTLGYATAVLAAATLLAIASWHLFEKHFLALKERWAPREVAPVGNQPPD